MPKKRNLTITHLREILRRQGPPKWGALYEAGIRANREEAPSLSRASQLWSESLGRYVHALSSIETKAAMLALWNPSLFELHEQRMLAMEPAPHPLTGHPRADGRTFPPLQGTIAVADRLDLLTCHPSLRYRHPELGEQIVATPIFGDLLLFLEDAYGPYCVNWSVKKADEDFSRSISLARRIRNPEKDSAKATSRHAIEALFHSDADIRTVRVVSKDIPDAFAHNLRTLFLHQRRPAVDKAIENEMVDRVSVSLQTHTPPHSILLSMVRRHACTYEVLRHLLFFCIWKRRVKADLFGQALLLDLPLRTEKVDPFKHYAKFFSREEA